MYDGWGVESGFAKLRCKVVITMMNYSHRQLLIGAFVTLLCLFEVCFPVLADEVEILALPYTRVEVVDVSDDSISFTTLSGKTIAKPLADVRCVVIDDFPLFSAAERLVSSGNHKDAVPVYTDALEGLEDRQKKLLEESSKLKKANKISEAERCARRSRAKWPKKLFEFRLEQAKKGPEPKKTEDKTEQIKIDPPEVKIDPEKEKPESCPICDGTGVIKCSECNGSGYVKCTHIDNDKKKHVNWYDICRKCNGKGKLPKRYKKLIHYKYKGKWLTKPKWITKYEPCPDCFDITDEYGIKIHVTWVCPHCGDSQYKGYIRCTKCNGTGKLKCEACQGTGLKSSGSSPADPAPAAATPTPALQKK